MLGKLEKFKKALSAESTVSQSHSEPEGSNVDDPSEWRGVRLKFAPDSGKVNCMFCRIFHFFYGSFKTY